jgi:hypothetical protein
MKTQLLPSCRRLFAVQAVLLAFTLLAWHSFGAQNRVKNPDFEDELGLDNWTIVYTGVSNSTGVWPLDCGPADFAIKGRTRLAHRDLIPGIWDGTPDYWSKFGGCFMAGHDWKMHAYFRQVVTNLTPGQSYTISARMAFVEDWSSKVQVYMEALGGAAGTTSRKTADVTDYINNNAAAYNRYAVTNTASASGQLEIRLHYNKYGATSTEKWRNMDVVYDHVTVLPVGATEDEPPYNINSMTAAGSTVTIGWETVSNHVYGIQTTSELLTGTNWSWANLFLVGTGNNLTVTNNLSGGPQYFRVCRLSPYE